MIIKMISRQLVRTFALLLLAMSFALALPQVSYASVEASKDAACEGVGFSGADCGGTASTNKVNGLVQTIVNVLSLVVGIVAVIMIIIGGFKYITSNGDSNSVSSAKNTLIYAIVGLIIIGLAQTIVRFVINNVR